MAKPTDILTSIVDLLSPLESEERIRIINASLMFLGETTMTPRNVVPDSTEIPAETDGSFADIPPRARAWMKQASVTAEALEEVFHVIDGTAEVIASHMPGKNKKEQTYNAYILSGIAQLIATGNASFSDSEARALCVRSGCYDSANHSSTLRDKGNEFTGTKDKGWTLTAPGLKRGADLIKELSKTDG